MLAAYAAAKAGPAACAGLLRVADCSGVGASGAAARRGARASAPQQQAWRGYAGAGAARGMAWRGRNAPGCTSPWERPLRLERHPHLPAASPPACARRPTPASPRPPRLPRRGRRQRRRVPKGDQADRGWGTGRRRRRCLHVLLGRAALGGPRSVAASKRAARPARSHPLPTSHRPPGLRSQRRPGRRRLHRQVVRPMQGGRAAVRAAGEAAPKREGGGGGHGGWRRCTSSWPSSTQT
jgi:hypothetical protein